MEKFQETYEKWAELNRQLYADCKEYLEDVLKKTPDNEIVINEDAMICVPYDGGNHPEYDSNCFSNVSRVYLKNDAVYLDIEETNEYPISNIDANSLCDVADAVAVSIEMDYDFED